MYADYDYYKGTYKGELDEETAEKLLEEASDQVDRLTYGRIRHRGFDNLTEYQQEMIKKAVCYQADFVSNYGDYLSAPLNGFSIGDVSLNFAKDNQGAGGTVADKKTIDCLSRTGLSTRRI
jgi:hypothetical protein